MTVKVIAFTKPINTEYGNSIKEFIAYVARVSNPDNQYNHDTAEKLLAFLETNKHWSPFEMADIVMEVETTRDIARQILRHRSFSFQEFSQRYAEITGYNEPKEARLQDKKNRQNSLEFSDDAVKSWWISAQNEILDRVDALYTMALRNGIAKEVARIILPEGLTKSRLYMKGSIRSWLHYFNVRLDSSTQKEHRELAEEMFTAFHKTMNE